MCTQQIGSVQNMIVQRRRQTSDRCKKAYRPIGRQMWPSDGRVHEHNELVAAHVQGSALEGPTKRAPVKADVLMEDVLGIAG